MISKFIVYLYISALLKLNDEIKLQRFHVKTVKLHKEGHLFHAYRFHLAICIYSYYNS
jgi:hypothetical protein